MLWRKKFLVSKSDFYYFQDDVGEYMIAPVFLGALVFLFFIAGFFTRHNDPIGLAMWHVTSVYFITSITIGVATIGTCYKYIREAENEDDLRFRIRRSIAFGVWAPLGLIWEGMKGIGKGTRYLAYELPVKTIWKKIDTTRTQQYELEHADELLEEEQKDVSQLLGK